jgi:hypothetical protein
VLQDLRVLIRCKLPLLDEFLRLRLSAFAFYEGGQRRFLFDVRCPEVLDGCEFGWSRTRKERDSSLDREFLNLHLTQELFFFINI